MAGVSGPCPYCHSHITAPDKELHVSSSSKTALPPKELPEHISGKKIRAAAEAIRKSARQEKNGGQPIADPHVEPIADPLAEHHAPYRDFRLELPSTEQNDDDLQPRKLNFFSFIVPIGFTALAAVVALGVFHVAGIINILNYQNGFKKAVAQPEKVTAPRPDTSVKVTILHAETESQDQAVAQSAPKESKEKNSKPKVAPRASVEEPVMTPSKTTNQVTKITKPNLNIPATKAETKTKTPPIALSKSKKPVADSQIKKINPVMANIMERGEFPELKLSPSAPKGKPITTALPTPPSSPSEPIVGYLARENLDIFISAKSLKQRLPFILKGQRSSPAFQNSSLAKPFLPIKSVRLLESNSGVENNMVEHRYMLKFEDPTQPGHRLNMIALLVERIGKHPPLIQAEAFLEHYDKALSQYAQRRKPDTATFHCIAEANTSDFADELPDGVRASMIRFTIKNHPYYPAKFDAYLSKSSPLMSHIGSGKSFPYTSSKYAVLSFRWNTTSEKPYIELVDIVNSSGWGG